MNVGQFLRLAKDVIVALDAAGVIQGDGSFQFKNLTADASVAKSIELIIKAHGVVVPEKVDQFLLALPILIQFLQ